MAGEKRSQNDASAGDDPDADLQLLQRWRKRRRIRSFPSEPPSKKDSATSDRNSSTTASAKTGVYLVVHDDWTSTDQNGLVAFCIFPGVITWRNNIRISAADLPQPDWVWDLLNKEALAEDVDPHLDSDFENDDEEGLDIHMHMEDRSQHNLSKESQLLLFPTRPGMHVDEIGAASQFINFDPSDSEDDSESEEEDENEETIGSLLYQVIIHADNVKLVFAVLQVILLGYFLVLFLFPLSLRTYVALRDCRADLG
ncbi:hypothetical protein HD806DRAFT_541735 [Xylariaceae sp. AK1471]|nr:hypothetical protein HD806DRAFT_541735 [Xylariaceae sp. AK1471]